MEETEGQRAAVVKHFRRVGIAKEEVGYLRVVRFQAHQRDTHIFVEAVCA